MLVVDQGGKQTATRHLATSSPEPLAQTSSTGLSDDRSFLYEITDGSAFISDRFGTLLAIVMEFHGIEPQR